MRSPTSLNGMPVTITETATAALPEDRWDWSAYRSPSRAKRRRDQRKVIKREPACYQIEGGLVMHPALWRRLSDSRLERAGQGQGGTDG